jgi:phosphatidylglycerol lysyltransferase
MSAGFVIFQFTYGLLFLSQLASQDRFNTAAQYIYQVVIIGWFTWLVRERLLRKTSEHSPAQVSKVRALVAGWAFLNGILAIVISLAHLKLLGHLSGLYFAGDGSWLAQHSIITGLVLLYLSRHLLRGERRARQIFVVLMGAETIKYSVISPHPGLLVLYLVSMLVLFVLKDDFDRGTEELTWSVRARDLLFLIFSLSLVASVGLILLTRTHELSDITARSIDNFFDYTLSSKFVPKNHLESVLLAHTFTAFILTSLVLIFWVIFRPARPLSNLEDSATDALQARNYLSRYANSSEDFFKVWPLDKSYFWDSSGFIAYRVSGAVAFALADPIGASLRGQTRALRNFIRFCRGKGWRACFLLVSKDSLPFYSDAGLSNMSIGASALIEIKKFSDETSRDKWWRWQQNRAKRSGFDYKISMPPHSPELLSELRRVSDSWLTSPGRKERGFALGYFDESYINQCPIHYLLDETSQLIAFTNQLPLFMKSSSTVTVDLLRYLPESAGAMPYLILKTIEHFKETTGYTHFDLGFVPFAAAGDPALKVIKALSTGRFSAKGLEQFKNKFDPEWQPNYIAYDGDLADLALIALNLEKALEIDKN